MILTALRLKNFRQYRGLVEMRFASDGERNVTVITGPNGAGKTSLFLALNWCLYGLGTEDRGTLITKGLDATARRAGAFVEVHFRHEGIRYIARRELSPVGDEFETTGDLTLTELPAGGQSRTIPNPVQGLNEILPADARQYFFFDGERIDEMSRPGHEEQVREAIRSVLKLKQLERAIGHLGDVEREFAQAVRNNNELGSETQTLVGDLERVRADIGAAREGRERTQVEIDSTQRQLDEVNDRLRSLGGVKDLKLEEARAEARLAELEGRSRQVSQRLADDVMRSGPALAQDAIEVAEHILDEKRQRGEIPSSIREQLIDDLLREGICVCGRPLEMESRRTLLHRKQSVIPGAFEDVVMASAGQIRSLAEVAAAVPQSLADALAELASLVGEMEDSQRQIEGVHERIDAELQTAASNLFDEDVSGLERTRRDLEQRARDLTYDLGRIERDLQELQGRQDHLSEQLSRVEMRSGQARREKRRYELAAMAQDAAEKLLQTFLQDMRSKIERSTDQLFKGLIWKDHQFQRIRILDDYRLDVTDRFGGSALRELSAGERQVLSLAFIVSMSRVTEEEAPLVIDTPFGRISEVPLQSIASELPNISGQLVLLVTDRELDEPARKTLAPVIAREYYLEFDDDVGATQVIEEIDR